MNTEKVINNAINHLVDMIKIKRRLTRKINDLSLSRDAQNDIAEAIIIYDDAIKQLKPKVEQLLKETT